ncbi:hypothetical protein BX666DRAFT_2029478 [Dichotomocladium elegans]|nr:hypothetical protein BX666DRAFT_2029478 [Dichotomocladium elegans]
MAPPNAATDTLTKDNSESQRDAESRGVQQSGGKLSKRLADQKRQSPHEQNPGEMPERLVWD